jgi:ketosteroid isomerase-like protein
MGWLVGPTLIKEGGLVMKRIFASIALIALAAAVAGTARAQNAAARETFKTADQFDRADVAAMREARNQWISAFTAGNPKPVEFMFTNDAVFSLPTALSARQLFERYQAKLVFDEKSEQFVTDGGDPRKMSKLPWVSYYSAYKLTLTPKAGGKPLETTGRFMTRFHRQPDGSLKVIRGPSVGDRAPDFTLNRMKGGGKVQLASLRGKPTVLIFGSYT